MTIRHLKIFNAVAKTQSMTQAAEQLYLSQPTVSQAIRDLEEHYGVTLFERLSKRLFITEAGRQLLEYSRPMVLQFDHLEHNMRQERETEYLHIGATITISSCFLPELMAQLETNRPNATLFALTANTRVIEEKLLNGELDIAIVEGEIESQNLVYDTVAMDFLVLAFSAKHPISAKENIYLRDIKELPFVMREQGSGTRALFESSLSRTNWSPKIKAEAPFPQAILKAILKNDCLSVLSVRLVEQAYLEESISFARLAGSGWNRAFRLVRHKDRPVSPAMQELRRLLKAYEEPFIKQNEISAKVRI